MDADDLVISEPTESDSLPARNSFDDLPKLDDGSPNLHRLLPKSFLLQAQASIRNGYASDKLAQCLVCLLYAFDQLYEANDPVTQQIEQHIRDYWVQLPKLPLLNPGEGA